MGSSIPPFPKAGFGTGTALVPLDTSAPQPPPASLLVPFLPSLILQKKVKAKQRKSAPNWGHGNGWILQEPLGCSRSDSPPAALAPDVHF